MRTGIGISLYAKIKENGIYGSIKISKREEEDLRIEGKGRCGVMKQIPITDPRVTPVLMKAIEMFLNELAKCKNNPDYLLSQSYIRTTRY